jgi:bile acid:Na+ symporter, BASS family
VHDLTMLLLKISLAVFMAPNLLYLGLRLHPRDAVRELRNVRFLFLSWFWGFVLCPALAYCIPLVIPLQPHYATGLVLIGMAPCAPFLPAIVNKAKGDAGSTAAFMVPAAVGTVVFMPFVVPLMIRGLTVSAWAIVRSMVMVILAPLAAGMLIFHFYPALDSKLQPVVKHITRIATIVMLVLGIVVSGKDFIGIRGGFAVIAPLIFFSIVTAVTYLFEFRIPRGQRVVISAGLSTRNVGAALAPLISAPGMASRATVMILPAFPVMVMSSLLAAKRFSPAA